MSRTVHSCILIVSELFMLIACFFISMRFLYLFWKCYNCNLYHHTLNTWVAYFVFNSVVLWIHIFYNLCQSAKKECNNFFFKMPSEVLNLADKQSFTWSLIYMFIKLNVKCLSGWLALIWFSILPNIVKFWFMSKSNASPFLTVKLTTLGQCLASKQDWLIYVYQIVYSYTFIHYA